MKDDLPAATRLDRRLQRDDTDLSGADGWVRASQPASSRPVGPPHAVDDVEETVEEMISRGKPMAALSHMSVLFGLPIFLVPLLRRENAFALHHAKAALATYLLFIAGFVASFLTCGLALPLALLMYVPAIAGVVHATRGELAGRWGLGDVGEKLLPELTVDAGRTSATLLPGDLREETREGRQDR